LSVLKWSGAALLLGMSVQAISQSSFLADYPPQALREGREGTSSFSVTVGTDGRGRNCIITQSSGHADLDAQTCLMIIERGRWTPAKDHQGNPVESTFASRVIWKIPH
jgi:protein TonB